MSKINIPEHMENMFLEKIQEHSARTGVEIDLSRFAELAILEKMERQFTKKMGHSPGR
tara:strand:+ start:300 stop:473 length:174 start_codon:yes stop_codon:yes gene_type:complete